MSRAVLLVLLLGTVRADGAELPPGELVQRALDHMIFRGRGAEMSLRLELRSRGGEVRQRTLFIKSRKVEGASRTLVRVLAPSDVAGTAFLFVERKGGEAEQHMYLPALKVTRRIAGDQKRASFMGSDFSYADLEWSDLDGAACRHQPGEKIGPHACQVIDCEPRKQDAYRKVRVFVRKSDRAPLRLQFFEGAGISKVLFVKELRAVDGWLVATALRMTDAKSGHTTDLLISDLRARDDLPPSDFTPQALRQR